MVGGGETSICVHLRRLHQEIRPSGCVTVEALRWITREHTDAPAHDCVCFNDRGRAAALFDKKFVDGPRSMLETAKGLDDYVSGYAVPEVPDTGANGDMASLTETDVPFEDDDARLGDLKTKFAYSADNQLKFVKDHDELVWSQPASKLKREVVLRVKGSKSRVYTTMTSKSTSTAYHVVVGKDGTVQVLNF